MNRENAKKKMKWIYVQMIITNFLVAFLLTSLLGYDIFSFVIVDIIFLPFFSLHLRSNSISINAIRGILALAIRSRRDVNAH